MKPRNRCKPPAAILALLFFALLLLAACQDKSGNSSAAIKPITSYEVFQSLVASSGDRLLVFEMYADWCGPCKKLSPLLEQVAVENKELADIYKVDVMKFPKIADIFGVKGIPFVQFVRNKEKLISLSGLRKKTDYEQAIRELTAGSPPPVSASGPSAQPAKPEQPATDGRKSETGNRQPTTGNQP